VGGIVTTGGANKGVGVDVSWMGVCVGPGVGDEVRVSVGVEDGGRRVAVCVCAAAAVRATAVFSCPSDINSGAGATTGNAQADIPIIAAK
jgi:hypothetical protein